MTDSERELMLKQVEKSLRDEVDRDIYIQLGLNRKMNLTMTFVDECWITKVIGESERILREKDCVEQADKLGKVNSWIMTHILEI